MKAELFIDVTDEGAKFSLKQDGEDKGGAEHPDLFIKKEIPTNRLEWVITSVIINLEQRGILDSLIMEGAEALTVITRDTVDTSAHDLPIILERIQIPVVFEVNKIFTI